MDWRRTSGKMTDRINRKVARQSGVIAKQASSIFASQAGSVMDRLTALLERADQMQSELGKRVIPQPKPRRGRQAVLLMAGAGLGYLVAYLMDPERGRARRKELAQRASGVSRNATKTAQRTAAMATDRAAGLRSVVNRAPANPYPDDLTLLDRVETEVFADPSIPKANINVMVVDGKAVLRGEVESEQIGAIESAVRKVVGVKDVENLLHTPGTPAPNKASARTAGNGSTH
ncbi:MAG: BON domain-containing protein [Candidatus Dormibacteraeota bacterium]|nr:BON domain-containing protein [Candidatus Dormibacteraeota bacterium]